jgi:transcriptional antiterminator RfaH
MGWCVLRSEPNRELTALRFLRLHGYDDVYLPRIREQVIRNGRRIQLVRPLFPNYLFLMLPNGRWHDARWTVGVAAVVMSGERPAVLDDRIVDAIRQREVHGAIELPTLPLKPGARVRVLGGPLQDQIGTLVALRPRERCVVLMAWLGRVELGKGAVEVLG